LRTPEVASGNPNRRYLVCFSVHHFRSSGINQEGLPLAVDVYVRGASAVFIGSVTQIR
jgi:hypothetical protein